MDFISFVLGASFMAAFMGLAWLLAGALAYRSKARDDGLAKARSPEDAARSVP